MQRATLESAKESFWGKVRKTNKCWIWEGAGKGNRYGEIRFHWHNRTVWAVHRFSWFIHFGDFEENLCVCHKCDNTKCVNPEHLFLGTHAENMRDMVLKGRRVGPSREECCLGYKRGLKLHPAPILRGEKQVNAKLTDKQAAEIKQFGREKKMSHRAIAKKYGVCHKTVFEIIHGIRWAHID